MIQRRDRSVALRAGDRDVPRGGTALLPSEKQPEGRSTRRPTRPCRKPARALDGRDFPDLPGPARSLPPLSLNLYGRLGESVTEPVCASFHTPLGFSMSSCTTLPPMQDLAGAGRRFQHPGLRFPLLLRRAWRAAPRSIPTVSLYLSPLITSPPRSWCLCPP